MHDSLRSILKRSGPVNLLRRLRYARNPPQWYLRQQQESSFYRQFVRAKDLCFDIGANEGIKTHAFRRLGARVVSVEPTPSAIATFKKSFANDAWVTLVETAVGAQVGSATLHIGDSSTISTLSADWMQRAVTTHRLRDRQWPITLKVDVTTLDSLIEQFGMPVFCKIDVEGYELEVLNGLSKPIPTLSFEYQPETGHNACSCIDRVAALGRYEFNWSLESPLRLQSSQWISADEMKSRMQDLAKPGVEQWGEIYARHARTS